MNEDLWEKILARLPLKSITTSKLVCKQWKAIVESPLLQKLFMYHHKNLHSSWSLFEKDGPTEVIAYYGCEIWGLPRSLGSYISSFLNQNFASHKYKIKAYTDVGLILISLESKSGDPTYYVANPISKQCVKIPPRPLGEREELYKPGLVTRIEKDVLLGYKVVSLDPSKFQTGVVSILVYSSETGLWSSNTLYSHLQMSFRTSIDPIPLNGSIYWIFRNIDGDQCLVSHDLYSESDRCQVVPFPDENNDGEQLGFRRSFTFSQESLMYMNIVSESKESKLRVWRLKSREWQLVYEISPIATYNEYFPLATNPFDGNTLYLWSKIRGYFASTYLDKGHKAQSGIYNTFCIRSRDGRTMTFSAAWNPKIASLSTPYNSTFVLPRWLHTIPSSPSS